MFKCSICGQEKSEKEIIVICNGCLKNPVNSQPISRTDCPLHPEKTINCRIFGDIASLLGFILNWATNHANSATCQKHLKNTFNPKKEKQLELPLETIEKE